MRVRFVVACIGAVASLPFACIPHVESDYQDYLERTKAFETSSEAGAVDTGPPPTTAVEGLYYGACLPQLAFGDPKKVFNFYVKTKFTPDPAGGGRLVYSLSALKLSPAREPPANFSMSGIIGGEIVSATPPQPNVDAATSKYTVELGTVNVPGEANPLSGSAVNIEEAGLIGAFSTPGRFCALLKGRVTSPVTLTLDPSRNICHFLPAKEGDPIAVFPPTEFQDGACPTAL